MTVASDAEAIRLLINQAIYAVKKYQSDLTGYIHYQHKIDANDDQTIPLYENFLFALALLRSRTLENIQEAKEMIKKLIFFQTPSGHFPQYLHEYPQARYSYLALHILPIYHWMIKDFYHVIGDELRTLLDDSLASLLQYCEKELPRKLPYKAEMLRAAAYIILGNERLKEEGLQSLEALKKCSKVKSWMVPRELSDLIVALQMVYPSIKESPWKDFWTHLKNTWWKGSYIGAPLREYQYENVAECTLYHLFMAYFSKEPLLKSKYYPIIHLQGALIRPCEERMESPPLQQKLLETFQSHHIYIQKFENHVISINSCQAEQSQEDTLQGLRLFWGKNLSYVVPRGKYDFDYVVEDQNYNLFFNLKAPIDLDNNRQCREITLYGSHQEGVSFAVEEGKATTFRLGESLSFVSGNQRLEMIFFLDEGEGKFCGHFMRGNRPGQLKSAVMAYDDMLFLRTIERVGPCRIRLSLKLTIF